MFVVTVARVILDTAHPFASSKHTTSDVVPDKSASMFRCHPKPRASVSLCELGDWRCRLQHERCADWGWYPPLTSRLRSRWYHIPPTEEGSVSLSSNCLLLLLVRFWSAGKQSRACLQLFLPYVTGWSSRGLLWTPPLESILRLDHISSGCGCQWWLYVDEEEAVNNNWK